MAKSWRAAAALSLSALLFLSFGCDRSRDRAQHKASGSGASPLSLDGVLNWRGKYGDLVGRSKDSVVERYGKADSESPLPEGLTSMYYDASPKTDGRQLYVFVSNSLNEVKAVKVIAKEGDELDVIEVIKKAPLFSFDTGTFMDSTRNYFMARTKDDRNSLQFAVSDAKVTFAAATFKEKD